MKISTRLSLLCSGIFGIVFVVIALVVYGFQDKNSQKLINKNLQNIAQISALFYLEEDELNSSEFDKIRKQFEELVSGMYYQVYNANNRIDYGEPLGKVSDTVLDEIRQAKQLHFVTDSHFCFGIFYKDNQGDYVIVAKEERITLEKQMNMLLQTLLLCFFAGLIAIILLSRLMAHIAYRPFGNVIQQVQNISPDDLEVRIASSGTKDELQNLIDTFNELLTKIAETAVIQRNFVKYVSHEFKTPLASLLGNMEVFSLKDRTPDEYRQLSEKLIRQANQMVEILETLMVVSDLRKETKNGRQTRLDELLWEIIDKVTELYPHSDLQVKIDVQPDEEQLLTVATERTQLLMMLFNLTENAVKYSSGKTVEIVMFIQDNRLCLSIADNGIGIMPEHLANISKPFYRADHTNRIDGSGIGLSIALRIMEKNSIKYEIMSEVNIGTKITMKWINRSF